MSDIPSTLEELQRDILQGDLTLNPYLQPSIIPAKDKELKTKAKKIIPGVNELLKSITNLDTSMQEFMYNINLKLTELESSLSEAEKTLNETSSKNSNMNEKITDFTLSYDEVQKDVSQIKTSLSNRDK